MPSLSSHPRLAVGGISLWELNAREVVHCRSSDAPSPQAIRAVSLDTCRIPSGAVYRVQSISIPTDGVRSISFKQEIWLSRWSGSLHGVSFSGNELMWELAQLAHMVVWIW